MTLKEIQLTQDFKSEIKLFHELYLLTYIHAPSNHGHKIVTYIVILDLELCDLERWVKVIVCASQSKVLLDSYNLTVGHINAEIQSFPFCAGLLKMKVGQ